MNSCYCLFFVYIAYKNESNEAILNYVNNKSKTIRSGLQNFASELSYRKKSKIPRVH